jgi:hypothetical protein
MCTRSQIVRWQQISENPPYARCRSTIESSCRKYLDHCLQHITPGGETHSQHAFLLHRFERLVMAACRTLWYRCIILEQSLQADTGETNCVALLLAHHLKNSRSPKNAARTRERIDKN